MLPETMILIIFLFWVFFYFELKIYSFRKSRSEGEYIMNKIDRYMEKEGWHLSLFRHYHEWRAHYSNVCHVGGMGKGKTADEAIENAIKNIGIEI